MPSDATAPGDPNHSDDATRSRTWQVSTASGLALTGYLPPWADENPSLSGVALEHLGVCLANIVHSTEFSGQLGYVSNHGGPVEETVIFSGFIDCHPHAEDPALRVPFAHLHLVGDHRIINLDPNGVADLAALFHAQGTYLENEVLSALTAARSEWAENHTS